MATKTKKKPAAAQAKHRELQGELNVKAKKAPKGGKVLYIEGYLNRATVDRAKEVILPKAWNLDNYMKNPVILFNHGKDPVYGMMPIGKAVKIEAREDGLYIKAQISNSPDERMVALRSRIDEGMLKTFSAGFDIHANPTEKDGGWLFEEDKSLELLEGSVVTIPCNTDSDFKLSGKAIVDAWREKQKAAGATKDAEERADAEPPVGEESTEEKAAPTTAIHALVLPREMPEGDAIAWAQEHGYDVAAHTTTEAGHIFVQKPAEDFAGGQFVAMPAGDGGAQVLVGIVGDTPAATEDTAPEAGATEDEEEEAEEGKEGLDEDPKPPVEDNDLQDPADPETTTEDDDEEVEEGKQAAGVDNPVTEPVANSAEKVDDNPHLALAKQTNVLLGQLIAELQMMSKKLDGLASKDDKATDDEGDPVDPPADPAGDDPEDDDPLDAKDLAALDRAKDYLKDVNERLNSLGV